MHPNKKSNFSHGNHEKSTIILHLYDTSYNMNSDDPVIVIMRKVQYYVTSPKKLMVPNLYIIINRWIES